MRSTTFIEQRYSKLDLAIALTKLFPQPEGTAVFEHRVDVNPEDPTDFEVVMTLHVIGSEGEYDPRGR